MKIVQLDSQISWRGGEQQVLYLSQALQAHGYENVTICPTHSALYQRTTEAGLPTYGLQVRHELDLLAAWKLGQYLRHHDVNILHMHAPHAHTIGLLACTLAPRVRQVVSRRVDFAPIRNLFSRWKYNRPQIQYLTVSDAVRQVMINSGLAATRIRTVHSGIDLQRFTDVPEAIPLFPPGTRVIGTVGHLAGHKGHRHLLDAMALILEDDPSVRVAIVGTGALREDLEAQAASLGLTHHVCFTGFRHDILSLIRGFEIFVFPSNLEGLGTSVLDAMALAKPVVATRAGGIPEMVQDGVTGLLVPPGDPVALSRAILQLLKQPELGVEFGEAGQRRVATCFTAERMARQTMQAYEQLMAAS